MPRLAGQKIKEMADIKATRKRNIVMLCSMIGVFYLTLYSVVRFLQQDYFLAQLNLFSSVILVLNIIYLLSAKQPIYSNIILSTILIFHAMLFLINGDNITQRLLWLYPIACVLIFVNPFKVGLAFSSLFCVSTSYFLISAKWATLAMDTPEIRFLLSLSALSILCNIYAFYYARMLAFVQILYKEGIEDLAYIDQLTGLANRWSFERWAIDKLEERQNSQSLTALVFLDIDNFKLINDNYGHDVGDRVLKHFASRLKNNIRNKDRSTDEHDYSIARFAGDEFVLLLYDVKNIEDLENILQRISGLFTSEYQVTERINQLTISTGVALYPEDAETLAELTRCADKAMYVAKHSGKNQYRFYRNDHLGFKRPKPLASVTSIKKTSGSCT
ncbi:GGDEF domain-containing protein [Vibrio salilacus]|uniref:GGDEF domain-containing protein n=1 Tax=Vibrio salilacus TaxID=1323749 RepID=UPI000C29668C|nr:GGDEF domain-containing protein [Vibrio salilacus]